MTLRLAALAGALLLAACQPQPPARTEGPPAPAAPLADSTLARATFAGGCFWCMEPPFDAVPGVVATTSGFTGGPEVDPSYRDVSAGRTGHIEAIEVLYDPAVVSYAELLDVYWVNVDPFDDGGQFCDRGVHYRSAIFAHDEAQEALAAASRERVQRRFREPVATEVRPASAFYAAEDYHQDFYRKNPEHYRRYRTGCRRDERLRFLWGDAAGGPYPARY